jgi:hypothetical protein
MPFDKKKVEIRFYEVILTGLTGEAPAKPAQRYG